MAFVTSQRAGAPLVFVGAAPAVQTVSGGYYRAVPRAAMTAFMPFGSVTMASPPIQMAQPAVQYSASAVSRATPVNMASSVTQMVQPAVRLAAPTSANLLAMGAVVSSRVVTLDELASQGRCGLMSPEGVVQFESNCPRHIYQTVQCDIMSLNGDILCEVPLDPAATGESVKEAVAQVTGTPLLEFHLLLDDVLVRDTQPLHEVGAETAPCFTMVRHTLEQAYQMILDEYHAVCLATFDPDKTGLINCKLFLLARYSSLGHHDETLQYLRSKGAVDANGMMTKDQFVEFAIVFHELPGDIIESLYDRILFIRRGIKAISAWK